MQLCVHVSVCSPAFCSWIFPVRPSSHDFTISFCTSLLFLFFYICVWPSIMLSSSMIFCNFSPSQTLLHRICLTPSKRNREMRGLFPPLFLFSFQPNYIPLLICLPFPLLRCFFLRGVNRRKKTLTCSCSLHPHALQTFCALSHFLSAFI